MSGGKHRAPRNDRGNGAPVPFADAYPNLARWVATHGWIEVGFDGMRPAFIRLLDEGGMLWEGGEEGAAVDDVLRAAEAAAERCIREGMAG
jgi:hypothetical protein